MTMTADVTTVRSCPACGEVVEVEANFCPACGTRQVDATLRNPPPEPAAADPTRPPSVTPAWVFVAGLTVMFLFVAVVLLAFRLIAAGDGDGSATSTAPTGDGSAADAVDRYAPIAAGWETKHEHVADEGDDDDSAGLATAAHDAYAWIDVNGEDLTAIASGVTGEGAEPFRELVGLYSRRYTVLSDIEAVATAGGTGLGSAADELAELDALDGQADSLTCELMSVMRAEGDDPADHVTPEMNVTC
jgi:hypothetical protein